MTSTTTMSKPTTSSSETCGWNIENTIFFGTACFAFGLALGLIIVLVMYFLCGKKAFEQVKQINIQHGSSHPYEKMKY